MQIHLQIDELAALLKAAGQTVTTPFLDQLLALAKTKKLASGSPESNLQHYFLSSKKPAELDLSLAVAGYCAIADGLARRSAQHDYWLRADPVSLQAGMSRVFLQAIGAGQLPATQRQQLEQTLNQHFSEDGLIFYLANNQRWYIHLQNIAQAGVLLTPPRQSLGTDISAAVAAMAPFWQRVFTELQMLLFSQDDLKERVHQGLAPISGLWLWGGGICNPEQLIKSDYKCFGQSCYLQGLAKASACEWQAEYNLVEHNLVEHKHAEATPQLIYWSGDRPGTAKAQLEQLETQVFQPLLGAIQSGAELELVAIDAGISWTIKKRWQWPWKKPLAAFMLLSNANSDNDV